MKSIWSNSNDTTMTIAMKMMTKSEKQIRIPTRLLLLMFRMMIMRRRRRRKRRTMLVRTTHNINKNDKNEASQ